MVAGTKGFGPEKDCAGKDQQHKRQTHALARECAPYKQTFNSLTVIKIWS
jgi:hypothetical protein